MTDTTPNYCDLEIEDSWINYLRTRLPYSFMQISEEKPKGKPKHFQLSEPVLLTGTGAAERHNFWRRGNVFYMIGKLMDYYSMSQVTQQYRMQEVIQMLTQAPRARVGWPTDAFTFYNSIQMEKVWGFVQDNHLDRERVTMTNVILSTELCLKAIMTHATFSETGCFEFSAGHDVVKLFEGLPDALRDDITTESNVFAKEYVAFRTQIEEEIKEISARRFSQTEQEAQAQWDQIAERIRESPYTAFVNSNDPGATEKELHEDWFKEALNSIRMIEDPQDISQYFRYAPQKDKDDLPVELISWILLLGRFLYEHLFPVPSSGNGPFSRFPTRGG